MNCTLENLELITMAESLELTRSGLRSTDPNYTETGILVVKVKRAIFDKKKTRDTLKSSESEDQRSAKR